MKEGPPARVRLSAGLGGTEYCSRTARGRNVSIERNIILSVKREAPPILNKCVQEINRQARRETKRLKRVTSGNVRQMRMEWINGNGASPCVGLRLQKVRNTNCDLERKADAIRVNCDADQIGCIGGHVAVTPNVSVQRPAQAGEAPPERVRCN